MTFITSLSLFFRLKRQTKLRHGKQRHFSSSQKSTHAMLYQSCIGTEAEFSLLVARYRYR